MVEKGLVKVTGIEPYKGEVLSRAGISATGLWAVNLEVGDNYDETAYDKATTVVKSEEGYDFSGKADMTLDTKEKSILFAVKVADTDNAARAAVSEYALQKTILKRRQNLISMYGPELMVGKLKICTTAMNVVKKMLLLLLLQNISGQAFLLPLLYMRVLWLM